MESGQNKTCLSVASLCSWEVSWLETDRAREFPEVGSAQGFEELFGVTEHKAPVSWIWPESACYVRSVQMRHSLGLGASVAHPDLGKKKKKWPSVFQEELGRPKLRGVRLRLFQPFFHLFRHIWISKPQNLNLKMYSGPTPMLQTLWSLLWSFPAGSVACVNFVLLNSNTWPYMEHLLCAGPRSEGSMRPISSKRLPWRVWVLPCWPILSNL